jgi:hypothetical protein
MQATKKGDLDTSKVLSTGLSHDQSFITNRQLNNSMFVDCADQLSRVDELSEVKHEILGR